ncbi:MAG: serine/threonine-protein kinase [Desulfobacteraceae bacterium]
MYTNENDIGEQNKTLFDLFKKMVKKSPEDINPNLIPGDRYRFEKTLGRGATGLVYKAWDKRRKMFVAIKASNKSNDSFVSEARLAGKLKHENIVSIYDANANEEISYVIMEYLEGDTLKTYCDRQNLLPLTMVSKVMIDICKGLHFAHSKGIIHRDIKPSNIMLNKQGNAKITDFGTSQMVDGTQPLGFLGTPSYVAPEQLKDDNAPTKASDIFSLGCVLYELLEGKKAFDGDNSYAIMYKVTNEKPEPLSLLAPPVEALFRPIVKKAIAKKAGDRYKDCSDLAYELSKTLPYLNKHEKAYKKTLLSTLKNRVKDSLPNLSKS